MRIEPFLLASTIRAVIAQRLVRRLCPTCRAPVEVSGSMAATLKLRPNTTVYEARGCDECGRSGYRGRTGVFEAVRVDDTLRRIINAGADEVVMSAHVFRNSPNLAAAARALVIDGTTSVEEAVRVTRASEGDE